jgi:ABC-type branched-subunit amino acid transport system substrate-binding protein
MGCSPRQGAVVVVCLAVAALVMLNGLLLAADAIRGSAPIPPALIQAKSLIDKGDHESAATTLRRYLSGSPPPEHLDDAYLLMGAALYGMKEYPETLKVLNQLQAEFPSSEVADRGKILLARTHAAMGNIDLALPLLTQVHSVSEDEATKREALQLTAEFLAQKKDHTRAIQVLMEELAGSPDDHAADTQAQIREFIEERLDRKALVRIRDTYPKSYPGDLASLRLIDYYTARNEDHLAEREIQLFLSSFPNHPGGQKASETLALIKTRLKTNQYLIAAVLPLSGRVAPFAGDVLEGIELALERGREQSGMPSIGLIVKDNESDRPSFLDELSTLLTDDRPVAVIGPMLSKNLPVLAEMAQKTKVPLITPAAMFPNVRRLGNYLFSTALTYGLQAKRIAAYAATEERYRRFVILHPDTVYGRELARLFAQEIRLQDGEIIATESFKEGETDFSPQIKRLKTEDLKKYGLAVPADPSKPPGKPKKKTERTLLYTPGFDAIFVPSRSSDIGLLAAQLAYHDVKVPLLGTNGWNTQDFARTADRTVDGAVFVDGFFVESPNSGVQDFVQRFQKRFPGETPSLFTIQGYDAVRVVQDAIRKGAASGESVREHLATHQDLPALTGPAGFGPDGILQRPLFLLQVKQGRFKQLD